MMDNNVYIAKRSVDLYVEARQREAATRRLARQMKASRQEGLPRWFRLLVCDLGYLLVSLGARLVEYGLPPYYRAKVETSRG
jgi:hypothetical protein